MGKHILIPPSFQYDLCALKEWDDRGMEEMME